MDLIKKLRETGRPVLNDDGSVDLEGIDFSAVSTWLRCGEQYRRRYILGKRSPPGIAMIEVTSHHKSMEMDNLSKRDKDKQLTASQLTEIFKTALTKETATAEQECAKVKAKLDWEGENANRLLIRAKALHLDYAGKWSHKFKPVGVEATFTKKVKAGAVEFNAYGQSDLTTKTHVLDYKTAARPKSQKDTDNDLQLSLYSWAWGLKKVGFIALVKHPTNPFVQYIESERTPGQWIWATKVLAAAVESIRKGSFPMVNPGQFPAPWWCSERFCGYWSECRGKYDPTPAEPKEKK